MSRGFSQMSTPPPSGPPPGYGAPPPGYGAPPGYGMPPPKRTNTTAIVLIILAAVFGGGIFVVAILAAILFPVFAKVRGNARLAACISNVKQIELGITMYTQDNNGKFPMGDYKAAILLGDYKAAILSHANDEPSFHCPSDVAGGDSYSFNSKLQGVSLNKVLDPRNTVAVYEGKNQTLDFRHEHTINEMGHELRDNVAVVGFVDGHVKAISARQVKFLRWKP